jgi:hypothetical protein
MSAGGRSRQRNAGSARPPVLALIARRCVASSRSRQRAYRLPQSGRSVSARKRAPQSVSAARRAWDNTHKRVGAGEGRQAETAGREHLRRWYATKVQPRLKGLQPKDVVRAIDVSRVYARQVIAGQVPHPRHFATLAKLVGVPAPKALKLAPIPAQGVAAGEPQSTAGP